MVNCGLIFSLTQERLHRLKTSVVAAQPWGWPVPANWIRLAIARQESRLQPRLQELERLQEQRRLPLRSQIPVQGLVRSQGRFQHRWHSQAPLQAVGRLQGQSR